MGKKHRKYSSSEKTIMKNIKKEREHICYYCNKSITERQDLTIDHKEPYDGTNTTYENCVICCDKCNGEKKGMGEQSYRDYLLYKAQMSIHPQEFLKMELNRIVDLFKSGVKQEHNRLGHKAKALRKLIQG